MGSVQQFNQRLLSCPGLCVLGLQREEDRLRARGGHGLVREAGGRQRTQFMAECFPGAVHRARERTGEDVNSMWQGEVFLGDLIPSHWCIQSFHSYLLIPL